MNDGERTGIHETIQDIGHLDRCSGDLAADRATIGVIGRSQPDLRVVEALVRKAWCEAFGNRAAEPGANILDMQTGMGRIVRLFAHIERLTGVALPASVAFQAPTVPALARLVAGDPVPEFVAAIQLKAGNGAPPLFIVPGLGGSVFQLFELARTIRWDGPIYVNQFGSLRPGQPPARTIDAIADSQVAAIKQVEPLGTCAVLGYSLGGVVALEVARRLLDRGEPVGFLGLLGPGLPEAAWPVSARIKFLRARLKIHFGRLRSMRRAAAFGYIVDHADSLYGRIGRLAGLHAGGWSPYRLRTDHPEIDHLRDANIEAMQTYNLKRYRGAATMFMSETNDPLACHPLDVWPSYIAELNVVTVPGAHETMLRGRHVAALAASVSACLETARMAGACSACIKGAAA